MTDSTWSANPANSLYLNTANWSGSVLPDANGTGFFADARIKKMQLLTVPLMV